MDIATILGLVVSFGLISTALLFGGDFSVFLNMPSVLIVLGGTVGAILTNYPLSVVLRTGSIIRKTLVAVQPKPGDVADQFMGFAYLARREGILALEPTVRNLPNPYLRKGLQLTVDGLEPEAIKTILETEINNTEARHETGVELLNAFASYAPALGLIGTVIGLVQMLRNMSDPSNIGPAMAVALITTFYGAILANLVFLPLCGKLKHRSRQELHIMEMQLIGILGIAKGENPRVIKETLEGFKAPADRKTDE
jgi:chemotaxis protein MotA